MTFTPTDPTKAEVRVTGVAPDQQLEFYIPRGSKGDKGDPGAPGQPNTLQIGTVATGATGSAAVATITGVAPNQALNLTLPRGATGATGNTSATELTGTGLPNGVLTAPVGTYYTDQAGTNGAWRWLKTSGTGNTGWTVIHGDTGWRNVAVYVEKFGQAGVPMPLESPRNALYMRRVNETVYASTSSGLQVDRVAEPTATILIKDPPGFTPQAGRADMWVWYGWDRTASYYLMRNGGWFPGAAPASPFPVTGGFRAMTNAQWPTSDAWPTTLPGSPA